MLVKGITEAVARLIGSTTEKEKLEKLLEKSFDEISRERATIVTSREKIRLFGEVIEDYNAIHRLPEKAMKIGLRDTPIMGSHTAAYAEQFAQRVVERINELGRNPRLMVIGQDITFSGFAYPDESILWNVIGYRDSKTSLNLQLLGTNINDEEIAKTQVKLGLKLPEKPEIPQDPIFTRTYRFDDERITDFYNCVGVRNPNGAPISLPGLFIPSTLLSLLREQTLEMTGINNSMNIDYLASPEKGIPVRIDIFPMKRDPRELHDPKNRRTAYLYRNLECLCSQNGKLVSRGEITCTTPYKLNLRKD